MLVVVLDGTYRQARLLNRKHVPAWVPRLKITPAGRSRFAPLRDGGDHRAEIGRTSTVEAVAHLLEALDPGFAVAGHTAGWGMALEYMVDAAKRQRGLAIAYGTAHRPPRTSPAAEAAPPPPPPHMGTAQARR